jgi:plasmid maintenance system antidote protein VapI
MEFDYIFDYSKLKGKIKEVFDTQENFAKAMELSHTSISYKLNNQREFTQKEINKAASLLGIADNEITAYFFTLEV